MPRLRAPTIAHPTGPDLLAWRQGVTADGQTVRPGGPLTLRALGTVTGRDHAYLGQLERAEAYAGEVTVWDLARGYSAVSGQPVTPETIRAAYSVTLAEAKRHRRGLFAPSKPLTAAQEEARTLLREGHTVTQAAARLGLERSTVSKWRTSWRRREML